MIVTRSTDDIRDRILTDAVARWAIRDDDILFISGSRAAGFGNRLSDLDVFLIFSHDLSRLFPGSHGVVLDDAIVDYQAYSLEAMVELARTINGLSQSDGDALRSVSRDDLDVYYRTAIGEVIWNRPAFDALRERFTTATMARVFHAWAALRSATALRRAVTPLHRRDEQAAFLAARSAVEWAVDAFLASRGEAFPSRKWRFEKLERACGRTSDVYRRAWSLKSLGQHDVAAYVRAAQEFCRELGVIEVPGLAAGARTPRRHRSARLFAIDGQPCLIHRRMFVYEIDMVGARIWQLMDGRTCIADIASRLATELGRRVAVTEDHVERFVVALETRGIIDPED